jgi:hypothetical protein
MPLLFVVIPKQHLEAQPLDLLGSPSTPSTDLCDNERANSLNVSCHPTREHLNELGQSMDTSRPAVSFGPAAICDSDRGVDVLISPAYSPRSKLRITIECCWSHDHRLL